MGICFIYRQDISCHAIVILFFVFKRMLGILGFYYLLVSMWFGIVVFKQMLAILGFYYYYPSNSKFKTMLSSSVPTFYNLSIQPLCKRLNIANVDLNNIQIGHICSCQCGLVFLFLNRCQQYLGFTTMHLIQV